MIKQNFKIPLYYVDVTLIQVESPNDASLVESIMKSIKTDKEWINYTISGIKNDSTNGGDTYRNLDLKKILVIFYRMTNERERSNVYSHEKRHIEDRILEWASIHDIESAGLLAGYLGEKFYEFRNLQNKRL